MATQKKILVVEDTPEIATMLEDYLKSEGYQVLVATDALQGFTLAKSIQPDLIILDIMMPAGGGYAVWQRLKMNALTRGIPVIINSAKPRAEIEKEFPQLDLKYYLSKPYTWEELKAKMNKIFGTNKDDNKNG
ncbi:MAG: response regulator [Elusimicrobiota bacterium]